MLNNRRKIVRRFLPPTESDLLGFVFDPPGRLAEGGPRGCVKPIPHEPAAVKPTDPEPTLQNTLMTLHTLPPKGSEECNSVRLAARGMYGVTFLPIFLDSYCMTDNAMVSYVTCKNRGEVML
jgi:hypothetical protein